MRYLPQTEVEIKEMLRALNIESVEDLFRSIPQAARLKRPLNLPKPMPEIELRHQMRELSRINAHGEEWASFLGAGAYAHYTPSAVGQLLLRGEFLTAYTPYQPEVSQGTLQAIFEYQTLVSEIFGMEIANASNYDGSTGTAEAALMALRLTDRAKVLVARSVLPEYRDVLRTYLKNQSVTIVEIPFTAAGTLDRSAIQKNLDDQTACLIAGYPNTFGIVEDLTDVAEAIHAVGALLVTSTPEPFSLGLYQAPGEMNADIAVGEGQGFGNPLSFGGPSLGLFATQKRHARSLPGRIVGETTDNQGRRGYVLTLATREQHIRRERATSNICTNVSLCALAATIALSLLGRAGFERVARLNFARTEALKKRIRGLAGYSLPFSGPTFNEFLVRSPHNVDRLLDALLDEKIFGGVSIGKWYPELQNTFLICVTELTLDSQTDHLVETLEKM